MKPKKILLLILIFIVLSLCFSAYYSIHYQSLIARNTFETYCSSHDLNPSWYDVAISPKNKDQYEWALTAKVPGGVHAPFMIGVLVSRFGETEIYLEIDKDSK